MNEVPKALKSIDVKAVLRKRGVYLKQRQNLALKEVAKPIVRKQLTKKSEKPLHPKYPNELVMEFYGKQIHNVTIVEQHFEHKLKQFLETVQKRFLANLEAQVEAKKNVNLALSKFKVKDVFDDSEGEWIVQAQIDFAPLLDNLAIIAGQDAYKLIGVDNPYLMHERLRAKIRANVEKFTKSMLDTDKELLTNLVDNGIEGGLSISEIRSQIVDRFPDYSNNQAQRITRTEVLRISNQATIDAYQQSGVVEGKQWLTAGATDECADYEGQVEALDGNFYGDTTQFADGDPPLHPNCRCILLPVLIDEVKAYHSETDRVALRTRIKELEGLVDRRTKSFKQLEKQHRQDKADDKAYIKALEGLLDE